MEMESAFSGNMTDFDLDGEADVFLSVTEPEEPAPELPQDFHKRRASKYGNMGSVKEKCLIKYR